MTFPRILFFLIGISFTLSSCPYQEGEMNEPAVLQDIHLQLKEIADSFHQLWVKQLVPTLKELQRIHEDLKQIWVQLEKGGFKFHRTQCHALLRFVSGLLAMKTKDYKRAIMLMELSYVETSQIPQDHPQGADPFALAVFIYPIVKSRIEEASKKCKCKDEVGPVLANYYMNYPELKEVAKKLGRTLGLKNVKPHSSTDGPSFDEVSVMNELFKKAFQSGSNDPQAAKIREKMKKELGEEAYEKITSEFGNRGRSSTSSTSFGKDPHAF